MMPIIVVCAIKLVYASLEFERKSVERNVSVLKWAAVHCSNDHETQEIYVHKVCVDALIWICIVQCE